MSVNKRLKELVDKIRINRDAKTEMLDEYKVPLEQIIRTKFKNINILYGGSLAKGTAIKNKSDVDLLCYLDSKSDLSVETCYNEMLTLLETNGFYIKQKNSAINVYGDKVNGQWETTVDVVPGKYTSNDDNKDVYLWCNKTKSRLKSNPEIQINKVKQSKMREVIMLIKYYTQTHYFKFKSFYLEIFAIDVVQPKISENDNLFDMLVKFCSFFNLIGTTQIHDPANSNNDIMNIHSQNEFEVIRKKIKELYKILLTNNTICIVDFLVRNAAVNCDQCYEQDALSHSQQLNLYSNYIFEITCTLSNGKILCSNETIVKEQLLCFTIFLNFFNRFQNKIEEVKFIVSNAGYEARGDLRGGSRFPTNCDYRLGLFEIEETTRYNGNHYVQAVVITRYHTYYSKPFIVRIRDFDD